MDSKTTNEKKNTLKKLQKVLVTELPNYEYKTVYITGAWADVEDSEPF